MAIWSHTVRKAALAMQVRKTTAGGGVLLRFGTVTTVTAGASTDGTNAVTVSIRGSQTPAPYLAWYTAPAVNDFVAVLLVNSSPLILGRVAGLPSF